MMLLMARSGQDFSLQEEEKSATVSRFGIQSFREVWERDGLGQ